MDVHQRFCQAGMPSAPDTIANHVALTQRWQHGLRGENAELFLNAFFSLARRQIQHAASSASTSAPAFMTVELRKSFFFFLVSKSEGCSTRQAFSLGVLFGCNFSGMFPEMLQYQVRTRGMNFRTLEWQSSWDVPEISKFRTAAFHFKKLKFFSAIDLLGDTHLLDNFHKILKEETALLWIADSRNIRIDSCKTINEATTRKQKSFPCQIAKQSACFLH